MRTLTRVLYVALLPCLLAGAGPGPRAVFTLDGVVRDRELDAPVADALVALVASGRSARTRADGTFTFGDAELTGADQLVITHPEYRTVRVPLGALRAGTWHLEIVVTRRPDVLGGPPPEENRAR